MPPKVTEKEKAEIRWMWRREIPIKVIAKELGRSSYFIREYLDEIGLRKIKPIKKITPEKAEQIKMLWKEGFSVIEIARKLDLAIETIRQFHKRNGLAPNKMYDYEYRSLCWRCAKANARDCAFMRDSSPDMSGKKFRTEKRHQNSTIYIIEECPDYLRGRVLPIRKERIHYVGKGLAGSTRNQKGAGETENVD